jgi:hypothetical protein
MTASSGIAFRQEADRMTTEQALKDLGFDGYSQGSCQVSCEGDFLAFSLYMPCINFRIKEAYGNLQSGIGEMIQPPISGFQEWNRTRNHAS